MALRLFHEMSEPPTLESIYDAHANALYAFLFQWMRSDADVKDVMQEVFRQLAQDPTVMEQVRHPRTYLLQMARRKAIDSFRRNEARSRAHEDLAKHRQIMTPHAADSDETTIQSKLQTAMQGLPETQRTVIHLRLREDLSFESIAKVLDISINTAASRYRYGIEKLRQCLLPLYEEIQ